MPILEGLHYLSHCFSSDHSHATHSYQSHEDGHDHAGLDMIDKTDDTHQDTHNSTTTTDTEKKYQKDSNEPLLMDFVEWAVRPSDYEEFHSLSRSIDIYTPPPQV